MRIKNCLVFAAAAALISATPPAMGQAHEHGVAEVGVALDGNTAQIEFTAPGSAIMGFEHQAKTASDKKKMADAFAKFKANTASMFLFDSSLGCTVRTLSIGVAEEHEHQHGEEGHNHANDKTEEHGHDHADVRALVDAKCGKPIQGSTLRFTVKPYFPEAVTLRVQVVGGDFQTGAELKGKRDSIRLSR